MRVAFALLALLSAFFAPPYLTLFLMAVLSLRYAAWEVILVGFLVDCLWFTPFGAESFLGFIPLFTIAGFLLVWGLEPLRREFLVR